MPPRKRARGAAASPTPTNSSPAPADASTFTPDSWTPTEESALFKAIIKAKPTGIHKHMHMICIAQSVREAYAASRPSASDSRLPVHLDSKGIWQKLNGLYDLAALDEREESYRESGPRFKRGRDGVAREVDSSDDSDGEGNQDGKWEDFSLIGPHHAAVADEDVSRVSEKLDQHLVKVIELGQGQDAEFASRMWARRLPDEGEGSQDGGSGEEADKSDTNEGDENEEHEEDIAESKEQPAAEATKSRTTTRSSRRSTVARRGSKASAVAESEDAVDDNEEDEEEGSPTSSPPAKKARTAKATTRRSGRKK